MPKYNTLDVLDNAMTIGNDTSGLAGIEFDISGANAYLTYNAVTSSLMINDNSLLTGDVDAIDNLSAAIDENVSDLNDVTTTVSTNSGTWASGTDTPTFASVEITGKTLTIADDIIYHATSYILDGMSEDKAEINLAVTGGNVYFEVESEEGGNVEFIFDELEYDLDCTTGIGAGGKAAVQLTEGTVTDPVRNFIVATISGEEGSGVAQLSALTVLPEGCFSWVGIAHIQSDTEVSTSGALLFQRTNEALKKDGRGALSYMREKLRFLGAEYIDGIASSLSITGADNVIDLSTTAGQVYQLHRQDWPALTVATDGIAVANASGNGTLTNFKSLHDLTQCLEFQGGGPIANNKRYVLTVWGAMNSTGEAKLFVNLPTDSYASDEEAINDVNNTAVTTVPQEFKTTAFLICKIALKYTTTGGGTWTNLLGGTAVQSLLGLRPGYNLGGASGSPLNIFQDDLFELYDHLDSTKRIEFELSGLSTDQTRILHIQDKDGTLAYAEDLTELASSGNWESVVTTVSANSADWTKPTNYNTTFTSGNISSGFLLVTHNLDNQYNINSIIVDNEDRRTNTTTFNHVPVFHTAANTLCADFSDWPTLEGTWQINVNAY